MAHAMSEREWKTYLMQGTHTAKLGTVTRDGRPVVSPVWFILDEEQLIFMTGGDSLKARNIIHNPRVSLSVDDETFPFSFVILHGLAEIDYLSPAELLPWSTRIATRYVPKEQAESYGKRNAVEGEVLIRVTPQKVLAYEGVAE